MAGTAAGAAAFKHHNCCINVNIWYLVKLLHVIEMVVVETYLLHGSIFCHLWHGEESWVWQRNWERSLSVCVTHSLEMNHDQWQLRQVFTVSPYTLFHCLFDKWKSWERTCPRPVFLTSTRQLSRGVQSNCTAGVHMTSTVHTCTCVWMGLDYTCCTLTTTSLYN